MSSHAHGDHNESVHHEESDINVRAIVTFAITLTVICVVIELAMVGMFNVLNLIETRTQPVVSPMTPPPAQVSDFPSPSLQTTPWADLKGLRAEESAYLHSYGWVDESAGVARVPIAKAKELLLQKGLPVRAQQVTDATEGTHYASTGESSGGRNLKAGGADASGLAPTVQPSPTGGPAPAPASTTSAPVPVVKSPGGAL